MTLGTCCKGMNALYFGNKVEFIFEVCTQIALLMALFGFMDMLIIIKWTTDWSAPEYEGERPPAIIQAIINMFVKLGAKEHFDGVPDDSDFIANQQFVMNSLLVVAGICIPCMLLVKPCYLSSKNKGSDSDFSRIRGENYENAEERLSAEIKDLAREAIVEEHEDHSFGELFIHQMIETIEYVLGTISNTASYLRLWALSLAHGQLAKVFLDYTVGPGFVSGNLYVLFFGFYIFFATTFAVLMVMDLLEAFLHTLRLHWVEFQNKFYKGNGYLMRPYNFDVILSYQMV